MKLSGEGAKFIIKEEGQVLEVYLDWVGYKTAGIGHLIPSDNPLKVGDKITAEQSAKWFHEDIKKFEDGVSKDVAVPVSQSQFDALVSFTFNIGLAGFAGSTLLKLLNQKSYDLAAAQFARWNKAGGQISKVLTARRERERKLFTDGVYA